jgi:hypothetical protein
MPSGLKSKPGPLDPDLYKSVGAASARLNSSQANRDEPWQRDTDVIIAAGNPSHQVKIINS